MHARIRLVGRLDVSYGFFEVITMSDGKTRDVSTLILAVVLGGGLACLYRLCFHAFICVQFIFMFSLFLVLAISALS